MNTKLTSAEKNWSPTVGTPGRRQVMAAVAIAFGGLAVRQTKAMSEGGEEISRTAESIHQEPVFKAGRQRVYEALTDPQQFNRLTLLSAAMRSGIPLEKSPTRISREVGGAFSLFGGYILGRHVELVPNVRIVQAWRAAHWDQGVYSIARFELVEQGSGSKIVFDHTGFPKGQSEHLAAGWKSNYWEPLQKFLA